LVFFATSTLVLLVFVVTGGRESLSSDDRGRLSDEETARVQLFQSASPSVVHVRWGGTEFSPMESRILDGNQPASGSGSGVVWNTAGYIVTNMHVVNTRGGAVVTLSDGSVWEASLVGFEPSQDLAVLAIEAPPERLVPASIGLSGELLVGQEAFAIGTPFGLEWTLTAGVISGLNRRIIGYEKVVIGGMIQTDAAINPGNSGGALLDSSGLLVGLITAIHGSSETNAGVGFAIPADRLLEWVPQIIEWGFEPWPELGLVLGSDEFSANCFEQLGDRAPASGVVIVEVSPGGAAHLAGIRHAEVGPGTVIIGDVIVGVDGLPVTTRSQLHSALAAKTEGQPVVLELMGGDAPREVSLTFGSRH